VRDRERASPASPQSPPLSIYNYLTPPVAVAPTFHYNPFHYFVIHMNQAGDTMKKVLL